MRIVYAVVSLLVSICAAGYGVYRLIDPGPSAIWTAYGLIGIALGSFACLAYALRIPVASSAVVVVAFALSSASAVAMTRLVLLGLLFVPGSWVLRWGSEVLYSTRYDPVGHPILWGLAVLVNGIVLAAVPLFVMHRLRVSQSSANAT